jgi:hypothetical protein
MKVYLRGGGFDRYDKRSFIMPLLHAIAPENSTLDKQGSVTMHRVYLPEGDPRVKQVIDLYVKHGIIDAAQLAQPNSGFWRVAHFTKEDFAAARYFWVDDDESQVALRRVAQLELANMPAPSFHPCHMLRRSFGRRCLWRITAGMPTRLSQRHHTRGQLQRARHTAASRSPRSSAPSPPLRDPAPNNHVCARITPNNHPCARF